MKSTNTAGAMCMNATVVVVALCGFSACAAGTMQYAKFSDVNSSYKISTGGRSNKDIVDDAELWAAQRFPDVQKVIQLKRPEQGIVVFSYVDSHPTAGDCAIRVTATLKVIGETGKATVEFGNIRQLRCGWISRRGARVLSEKFKQFARSLEKTINPLGDQSVDPNMEAAKQAYSE